MASQSTVRASLVAQTVPEERQCVKTGQDVVDLVQDYVVIDTLTSATGGSGFPSTNNAAAQAQQTANDALALAQSLDARTPATRSSGGTKTAIPAGESNQSLSWSDAMPSTAYMVDILLYGTSTATTNFSWCVVDGTEGTNSVQLRFTNIPAGFSFTWQITQLL